jgi:hypothetical protein
MSEGLLPSIGHDPTVMRPALQISYDSDRDFLWALVPGAVIDGQMEDEVEEHLDGLFVYRRGPEGPVIGFGVDEAFAWDVMGNLEDEPEVVWGGKLRFDAPTLALSDASIGEIVLAAQATISSSTPDVILFDLAVAAGCQEQWDDAEGLWRACLEAGDMKAHFGLGYTLVELGRPREAFGPPADVHGDQPAQLVGLALAGSRRRGHGRAGRGEAELRPGAEGGGGREL